MTHIGLTDADRHLIVAFAGCSLDEKPGSNWVQNAGGLPAYICRIAKAIKRTGKSTSQAIAIAVSRVKKWATGAGVDKDTQAKSAKAVAEWEKIKAKGDKVSATASFGDMTIALTDEQLLKLVELTPPCHQTALDQVLLSIQRRPDE